MPARYRPSAGILAFCAALALAAPLPAAEEVIPPVSRRFAETAPGDAGESPGFRRHVSPLLGRLGCNGRECHGSFQGQGGFQLSLFGYDFAADHAALTADGSARVDRDDPEQSLILQKPTLTIEHKGGRRYESGGWEYRLLRRWIEAEAPSVAENHPELASLSIEPEEIVLEEGGREVPLRAVARWSDGTSEDVTPLCRFQTNDESVAAVTAAGVVAAAGPGDSHIIVFYDNAITPVPVVVPVSEWYGDRYPEIEPPTKIDELVAAKLRKVGLNSSELCSDAEFLRRASLDLTGTLPMPEEILTFLADERGDKRRRKIDELLQRPAYSAWWATRLGDLWGNSEENLPVGGEQGLRREKSAQWYDWLERRLRVNAPYDEIVERMLLAVSRRPGQTDDEYFAEMSAYFREQDAADFAERESMPYFWTRGRFSPPQPLRFSYALLGIRLECAQCHKHPYDQWTKDDHDQFQTFFDGVGFNYGHRGRSAELKKELGLTADQDSGEYKRLFARLAKEGTVVPWGEVSVPSLVGQIERERRKAKITGRRVFTPRLLGGEEVLAAEYDDARRPLMEWLRQPDNPYFARAMVNRVWANHFGAGIVDPPDDMNLANPASNEPLLAWLAGQFIAHAYDLKWLHGEIMASAAYQRSWRPNDTNRFDERNFSRAIVRRLPAEVAYDAILLATAGADEMRAMHFDPAAVRERAIGVSSGFSRADNSYAMDLFGKPSRDGICDCQRSADPSLLQTIYLRNDPEVLKAIDRAGGWLSGLAKQSADRLQAERESLVGEAYLRTFGRPPSDQELAAASEHLAQSADTIDGLRDLLWALLNSKEFLLNH